LVLHGGTGLTEDDFRNCFHNGIKKINIATASYDSVASEIKATYQAKPESNYFDFSDAAVTGTYKNIIKHMHIFEMQDKA
jgi:fructose-bisphosphate aldolase class II